MFVSGMVLWCADTLKPARVWTGYSRSEVKPVHLFTLIASIKFIFLINTPNSDNSQQYLFHYFLAATGIKAQIIIDANDGTKGIIKFSKDSTVYVNSYNI